MAQDEYPPPSGKGRVVVMASGATRHTELSRRRAQGRQPRLRCGAVRFEQLGRNAGPGPAQRHRAGAAHAACPAGQGRAGGLFARRRLRAGLWHGVERPGRRRGRRYLSTTAFKDPPAWAGRVRVPTVMFAGENDTYHNCCVIDKARAIARAAQAAGAPFELTTYPRHAARFQPARRQLQGASQRRCVRQDGRGVEKEHELIEHVSLSILPDLAYSHAP